jgi:hypothetical protein
MGGVVVAIPVKDEEDRIAACLDALDNQNGRCADHVVLLLNNCSDQTAAIVRAMTPRMRTALDMVEVTLPPDLASAGMARRLAMERAAELAGLDGILLTTDADARVDPGWIDANLDAIEAGADAVAGWVELDPIDWSAIPLSLHEDDARECGYDAVCDAIHALLDPDPADPLPRHTQASGASIAVTALAYRLAGGIPAIACGEDRAFLAALRRVDARIRHAPECRVVVSGRTEGRAAGGMADTIRRRLTAPDPFLDDRLEPADACARRATMRHLAGLVHAGSGDLDALATELELDTRVVAAALGGPYFGTGWARLEAISARLGHVRVPVAELAVERARADALRYRAARDPARCREALLTRTGIV